MTLYLCASWTLSEAGPAGFGIARRGWHVAAHENMNRLLIVDGYVRQWRIPGVDVAGDEWKAAIELGLIVAGNDDKRNGLTAKVIERESLVGVRPEVPPEVLLTGSEQALRIGRPGSIQSRVGHSPKSICRPPLM